MGRILVESPITQRGSLTFGIACHTLAGWAAALAVGDPAMTALATMLTVAGVTRIALGRALLRLSGRSTCRLETLCRLSAFSFSILCGLLTAQTIACPAGNGIRILMVAHIISYGIGVAMRNAGRPAVALGHTTLAFIPLLVAFALQSSAIYDYFSLALLLILVGVVMITLDTNHVLRDSVSAAEASNRLADSMQRLARTDVVTGLLNRAGLNHHLVERLVSLGEEEKLALLWLDLDRFKEVNDTLGHQVGDQVLAEVGIRLKAHAPAGACVARFGGDEFIVACDMKHRSDTGTLAQGLLEAIARPISIDGNWLEIASSIGIAILPDDAVDLDTVMQGADLALYHAKVNGRKQVSFFDPAMTRDLVRRKQIEAELRLALQRNELSVYFQPIVDLETGRIHSFEALVRWFHPEKGELRPDEFIPVAEECGAIITLGNWITAQAARCAADWPPEVSLAVNFSPLQIRAPGAALGVLNALRDARLDPRRLVLEITETVLLEHGANTEAFMAELIDVGVRFALDDFGTGYSSLSYLNKYPFSKIKVDRSFVSGASAGLKSDAIIRAVSGMAATLGMEVVAEGLETRAQVEAVRLAGCTMGQGFFFSPAVPHFVAARLLAEEREQGNSDRLRA